MQVLSNAAQRFLNNCRAAAQPAGPRLTGPTEPGQPTLPRSSLSSFFVFRGASTSGPGDLADGAAPGKAPLRQLREEMLASISDCPDCDRQRMTVSLGRARTGMDLWLLRSDIFQCVSRERGQQEARRRVNGLMVLFAHHVPEKQLVAI